MHCLEIKIGLIESPPLNECQLLIPNNHMKAPSLPKQSRFQTCDQHTIIAMKMALPTPPMSVRHLAPY
jgi:hypothetical protein